MKVHRILAVVFCATAFACGSDEINGLVDPSVPEVQPGVVILYGYVAVNANAVRLQGINGPSAILTGPLVDELRDLDGAFVIVRGEFTGEALDLPMLTVESYEVIKAATR